MAEPMASLAYEKRLRRRHAVERRFRAYGMVATGFVLMMLFTLLASIIVLAKGAFWHNDLILELTPTAERLLVQDETNRRDIATNVAAFDGLVRDSLIDLLQPPLESEQARREMAGLFTRLAVLPIAEKVAADTSRLGRTEAYEVALADDLDLYLKGRVTAETIRPWPDGVDLQVMGEGTDPDLYTAVAAGAFAPLLARMTSRFGRAIGEEAAPTVLIETGSTVLKLVSLTETEVVAVRLAGRGLTASGVRARPQMRFRILWAPASDRSVSDLQIAFVRSLKSSGVVQSRFNTRLFTSTDSTYPELAGTLAALMGSLFTMLVTALVSIPIGIMAALYLQEFAPRNKTTRFIEVNINNLAGVPSIVFGLLGAVVFLNFFGLPRSAPLVGGLVLALLTLPTIIIASRAALNAVPQDIRDAALSVGASRMQTVIHHVLPLAGPGILTGAIIGMARAFGETAPLLLIGMVAFVAEVPAGVTDEATTLPVLIYKWSTGAERAWEPLTAATIVILLLFMVLINAGAVYLRQRFEKRW